MAKDYSIYYISEKSVVYLKISICVFNIDRKI